MVDRLESDVSLLPTIIYTSLKILAMENVKIKGLSELSRELKALFSHIFMEISARLTERNCSPLTNSLHETFNQFFRSHYGHSIAFCLEGLIEVI